VGLIHTSEGHIVQATYGIFNPTNPSLCGHVAAQTHILRVTPSQRSRAPGDQLQLRMAPSDTTLRKINRTIRAAISVRSYSDKALRTPLLGTPQFSTTEAIAGSPRCSCWSASIPKFRQVHPAFSFLPMAAASNLRNGHHLKQSPRCNRLI
jgi:hypothetical protein